MWFLNVNSVKCHWFTRRNDTYINEILLLLKLPKNYKVRSPSLELSKFALYFSGGLNKLMTKLSYYIL